MKIYRVKFENVDGENPEYARIMEDAFSSRIGNGFEDEDEALSEAIRFMDDQDESWREYIFMEVESEEL